MAYRWLQEILDLLLPELEDLPAGAEGEAKATAWFERLLVRFAERGLSTPAQQKNRVVDTRNAIRVRFGDDHPSLAYVGFDESTWQVINLPTHDRTEARNEHQRLLRKPERIVAKAAKLLESGKFEDLAVGLGLTTGRRMSELLNGHAKFEPATAWSVMFTGQRKHKGDREGFCFEIPTLAPAEKVLKAWERLAVMLGDEVLDPQRINNRYGHQVNEAADRHFRGLIPPRLPRGKAGKEGTSQDPHAQQRKGDALYLHLFRAVYATIAVHWFCPPRVNRLVFKAEIQGHRRVLEAPTRAMRRSYTAARHYDDYQVADKTGKNLDGRQGIKLGKVEGVEVLRAFQKKEGVEEAPVPPTSATPAQEPAEPKGTPLPAPTGQEEQAEEAATEPAPPSPERPPADSTPPDITLATSPETPMPTKEAPATPAPSDTREATPGQPEVAQLGKAKAKKPRPVTYRIYPADRPRLDAFRTEPKQPQADNMEQVLDLLENASAAIRDQDQAQVRLQVAQAEAEQRAQERDQARLEAREATERLQSQEAEVQRLQEALEEAQTAAARQAGAAAGGGSTVALAVVARELLGIATGEGCPPQLQGKLISLATQALGTVAPAAPAVGSGRDKRQDGAEQAGGARKAGQSTKPGGPERFFGPLFAAGGGERKREQEAVPNEAEAHGAKGQEPTDKAKGATVQAPVDQGEREQARGAKEEPVDKGEVAPRAFTRRGGAAEKLERALQAVVAHNEAQTSREKKWALTESSLARLTGCFRPAVRGFFDARAKEVEAHNQRHHLTGGHNAARGKKGETIEAEVGWRRAEEIIADPAR